MESASKAGIEMKQSGEEDLAPASDDLLARIVRFWAEEKLHYVREYTAIFTTGMKDKWTRRAYIDLFAGPGKCLIEDNEREIDGSPLIAATTRFPFTDLYLNDNDEQAAAALRTRLARLGRKDATVTSEDCNAATLAARRKLFSGVDATRTLGLAFIDPTGFQIKLSAIEDMTRGLKIDLIITVMTGYLRQFIGSASYQVALDGFFGSNDWRELVDLRKSGEQLTFRRLLDHYEGKLKDIGYLHVDDHIRILNSRDATIYHLVFASKHPRGAEFFKKIRKKRFGGQWSLDLGEQT